MFLATGAGFAGVAATLAMSPPRSWATGLAGLRSAERGAVLLPGDAGFEEARTPWSLSIDQEVRAVVEPVDVDDAAALVRYARDSALALATQPTGHGASGSAEGTILVRTRRFDDVQVDRAGALVQAGAGVSWARVAQAAAPHGLLALSGSAPGVGVAGYTLGGGLGWFSRRYGLGAAGVRAFEGLNHRGEPFRATADSDPELFWALSGGGGDYALITRLEVELQPVREVFGGSLRWPLTSAPAVLRTFREVTASVPEDLTIWFNMSQPPGGAPASVGVDTTFLGDPDTARRLLSPFEAIGGRISDTLRSLPGDQLGTITNEPTRPSPGRQRATLLSGLPDAVVDAFAGAPIAPLLNVQIRHLGGALARPSNIAADPISEPYLVNFTGMATSPGAAAATDERVATYLDILATVDSGRTPFNFLAPTQTAAQAFSSGNLERLRRTKRTRDPQGIFRSNYPVLA